MTSNRSTSWKRAAWLTVCAMAALPPSSADANVLVSETPQYRVVVEDPPSNYSIASNAQQTTLFSTDGPFLMQAGPGQSQTVSPLTQARFEAKSGFILTGLTISGGAVGEAWEGGYSIGGTWAVGTLAQPTVASGSFPTISNVTFNQNAAVQFPGAQAGVTSPVLSFRSNLQLRVSGSAADCGRVVCAQIGAPFVRVDVAWAAAPTPVPSLTPIGIWGLTVGSTGLGWIAVHAARRPRRADAGRNDPIVA